MSAHSTELTEFERDSFIGASRPVDTQPKVDALHAQTLQMNGKNPTYRRILKPIFDFAVVLLSIPIWFPVVMIAALLVALDGHNPFYSQKRLGRGGRAFRMWKLRSMVHDADARLEAHLAANPDARAEWNATQKLKNDPRITAVGRILRKTSFDELPQLFNVLIGNMSLVGPRPMMVSQQDLYHGTSYYALRPGLTGFWQISDRNECRFADRVRFDDAYSRVVSLRTDLTVLFKTVSVVLHGTGY